MTEKAVSHSLSVVQHADESMMSMRLNTAVLFLVFNRPELTAQVFEAIRKARPPRLYIAADGPRPDHPRDVERVARVRTLATAVDWPCEVRTLFRETNLGCRLAVSGGLDWFFEQEACGLVLEDDCLPSPSFFGFSQAMLERYRDDERVMSVCGTQIYPRRPFSCSYSFSHYAQMWGWATWRRAWLKYDRGLEQWPRYRAGRCRGLPLDSWFARYVWASKFERVRAGLLDTWDYQWIFSCWISGGLTIVPAVNLVRNLGVINESTHTKRFRSTYINPPHQMFNEPLIHPECIAVDEVVDRFVARHRFGATPMTALKIWVLQQVSSARSVRSALPGCFHLLAGVI